jgi:hypothetical protein
MQMEGPVPWFCICPAFCPVWVIDFATVQPSMNPRASSKITLECGAKRENPALRPYLSLLILTEAAVAMTTRRVFFW